MEFSIKLKIFLQSNHLLHNFFLLAFPIVLLYLTFNNFWYSLGIIIYLGYLKAKQFDHIYVVMVLLVVYSILIGLHYFKKSKLPLGSYGGVVKVSEVIQKNTYSKVILEIDGEKVIWNTEDMTLKSGMKLTVKGEIKEVFGERVPYGFNEKNYLKYQSIYRKIKITEYQIISKSLTVYSLNEFINDYYDNHFTKLSSSYLKALVLGNKNNLDEEDAKRIGILGISHLFVVSGLHVGLLILIIQKVLTILKVPNQYQSAITYLFLLFYLLATAFLIAVIRVLVGEVLKRYNQKKGLGLDSVDLLSINFLIVAFIIPLAPFQYAFILTYLTTFSITLSRKILTKYSNNLLQSLVISIVTFLMTFPIIINISGDINFISIIYNVFYIPLVSFIILPLSLIVTFLPFLGGFYHILIQGFSASLHILAKLTVFQISFPKPNPLFFGLYYFLILTLFSKWEKGLKVKKELAFLSLVLFAYYQAHFFYPLDEVTFLDLREGDATFIGERFNRMNILIDTGEVNNSDLFSFLKGKGVHTIHYLIISHGDSDHCGQASEILNNFSVHYLVLNAYDSNDQIRNIINNAGRTKVIRLRAGDELLISDRIKFQVLSPSKDNQNVNDNSLVLLGELFGIKYLFTGDISSKVEKDLISKSQLKFDILKVAHHGSATSSSEIFLDHIESKIAVIMSGSHNTFGFPNPKVYARLQAKVSLVVSTSNHYTITFRKKGDFIKIKSYQEVIYCPLSGDT